MGLDPSRPVLNILRVTEWAAETACPDATLYRFYPHGCMIL